MLTEKKMAEVIKKIERSAPEGKTPEDMYAELYPDQVTFVDFKDCYDVAKKSAEPVTAEPEDAELGSD